MNKDPPLWLIILLGIVIIPPLFMGSLVVVGMVIEGRAEYAMQRDQCLKNATNGYKIKQCRR